MPSWSDPDLLFTQLLTPPAPPHPHPTSPLSPCADWPPAMPSWSDPDLLFARLRLDCPGLVAPPPAFANATLCCSLENDPALASALGNGFRASCSSPCVYNPLFASAEEGSTFPAWMWDPDNECWVSKGMNK